MIAIISTKLAHLLSKYDEKTTDVEYIRYGIEILLGGFIKVIVLFGIALILGLFQPVVWVFFTFVLFRLLTGGHHYATYLRCLIVGLFMMLGIAYIVTQISFAFNTNKLLILLFLSIGLGILLVYKYAPSNHFYKKCTETQKKSLKKYAYLFIFIWGSLIFHLIFRSYSTDIILASIFGFLFQIGSIHPYSYLFVKIIEKNFEKGVRT